MAIRFESRLTYGPLPPPGVALRGSMKARDFPSYRLRHSIRVWRIRRRFPWAFHPDVAPLPDPDEEDVVIFPPSDVFDRTSDRRRPEAT